eukprot:1524787-Prymnesium_polylepis.2
MTSLYSPLFLNYLKTDLVTCSRWCVHTPRRTHRTPASQHETTSERPHAHTNPAAGGCSGLDFHGWPTASSRGGLGSVGDARRRALSRALDDRVPGEETNSGGRGEGAEGGREKRRRAQQHELDFTDSVLFDTVIFLPS